MTHIVHYTDIEGHQATAEIDLDSLEPGTFNALEGLEDVRALHTIHPADQDCPRCR
jgi:hypothetical protein